VKSKNKSKKARLRKGALKEIISLAKKKYSIPDSIFITTQTVRQRIKRGRNNGHHKTPMEDVEPYPVELVKKLAEMRTPVTTARFELANSLIKGKSVEKNLEKWKSKYSHGYRLNGGIKLGKTCWIFF
jgi:hypothetical protein